VGVAQPGGLVLRFIAEGVAIRDGVCAHDSFCTGKLLKNKGAVMWLRVGLAVLNSEVKAHCISCRSPSGNGKVSTGGNLGPNDME
jgi:hypothetical protein